MTVDGVPHVCSDADYDREIAYLKRKVDAGASLIITQLFYDINVYNDFVSQCRRGGITIPILPGIMPIRGLAPFHRMTKLCKTRIPDGLKKCIATGNKAEFVVDLCNQLLGDGAPGLHFYTLNDEVLTFEILKKIDNN